MQFWSIFLHGRHQIHEHYAFNHATNKTLDINRVGVVYTFFCWCLYCATAMLVVMRTKEITFNALGVSKLLTCSALKHHYVFEAEICQSRKILSVTVKTCRFRLRKTKIMKTAFLPCSPILKWKEWKYVFPSFFVNKSLSNHLNKSTTKGSKREREKRKLSERRQSIPMKTNGEPS